MCSFLYVIKAKNKYFDYGYYKVNHVQILVKMLLNMSQGNMKVTYLNVLMYNFHMDY